MKKFPFIIVVALLLTACESLVEIDSPKTELSREIVFRDEATANAALQGIYYQITATTRYIGNQTDGLRLITAQSADEYTQLSGAVQAQFFENEITPDNVTISRMWRDAYNIIYATNAMLEGLENAVFSETLKRQMEGEARFLRAFNYFYLVNLFGDVPLITRTDFRGGRLASRAKVTEVYQLIEDDLVKAKALLPSDYLHAAGERIRVNQAVASALLARTYLYIQNWENAEAEATNVINDPAYEIVTNLSQVFLSNSKEAIWQLLPTMSTRENAPEAYLSLTLSNGTLTSYLKNAFESNDLRRSSWTVTVGANTYARKYKATSTSPPKSEYSIVFRLAEQYLIRAEARAQQGNLAGAKQDIDMIRTRAGLPATTANTQSELLRVIEQERRIELFTEYGHRWLDLKRWENADEVLSMSKPFWDTTDALFPIPQGELLVAPNLTQNLGY